MKLDHDLQRLRCLGLAIAGTNGKSTTSALLGRMLQHNQRRIAVCGPETQSPASLIERSVDLDYAVLQLDVSELKSMQFFRPAVAVLLNIAPDPLAAHPDADSYARAFAPLFANQQFFDWAIIQARALAKLRELDVPVPAKTITFSATDPEADLIMDRGLLVSRIPGWEGPLLDFDHCLLRGGHNAENLLAAVAVGHVLRIPLEGMADALKTFYPGPHRCELVAEIHGVQFVNDSKSSNLDAMEHAVLAQRPGPDGRPNVWLIAGGTDEPQDFHAAGAVISNRVKGAVLIGKASQKIRSAWSLFTPCATAPSLLEAVAEAARNATSGDVILLSPACSGLDQFRNHQHRGQVFYEAVKSIGRGRKAPDPYMHGLPAPA